MLRLLFVATWLCFLTTTGLAQFVIDPITYSENDCSNPALAAGPDDISMLAFVESGGSLPQDLVEVQIMVTTRTDTYFPYDPVELNTGEKPEICWAWDGFHVAFVSGETIFIYHSNTDGQWDLETHMASPQTAFYVGSYTQVPQLFFQGGDDPNNLHLKSSILVPGGRNR